MRRHASSLCIVYNAMNNWHPCLASPSAIPHVKYNFCLQLKTKKCTFMQAEVVFLGHIVGCTGLVCDPAKLTAVQNWHAPDKVKGVRQFVGLSDITLSRNINSFSRNILFRFHKILFCFHSILFRFREIISRFREIISRFHEIISRFREIISCFHEIISHFAK